MGLIMPRRGGLTADVSERFESFVVLVLLPLFFVVTGLRTEVNALNRPELWAITVLLIAVAIVGKFVGAMLAARYGGFSLRDSAAIGALMNTRGLTELIVLNIGLELGRDLDAALHDARRDGARDDLHGRPDPAADRPAPRAQRAGRGGAAPGGARPEATSRCRCPHARSSWRRRTRRTSTRCSTWPSRSRSRRRRASSILAELLVPDRFVTGTSLDAGEAATRSHQLEETGRRAGRAGPRRPHGRVHEHPARPGLRPARLGGGGRPRPARRPAAAARRGHPARSGRRGAREGAVRRRRARRAAAGCPRSTRSIR